MPRLRLFIALASLLTMSACANQDASTPALAAPPGPTATILWQRSFAGAGVALAPTGTIQERGLASYQYGTHVLLDDTGRTLYALRCGDRRLLDNQIGRLARVTGTLAGGYPLDNGPPLLDVTDVQAAGR